MKHNKLLTFFTVATLTSQAQASDIKDSVGAGLGISTLGVSATGIYDVSDSVSIRGQLNHFSYGSDFSESDIKYDADLKLSSFGVIADWHPWEGSFRVSAGAYYNGNKLEAKGKPKSGTNFIIGGTEYTLDSLNAEAEFNSFSPYLGVGWSVGRAAHEPGWSFDAELGVLFQGSANVELKGSGTGASAPGFGESIKKEEDKLEDELGRLQYYPVVGISATYRF